MKYTYHVPVQGDQEQLQATVARLFPGVDPQITQRATGTSNVDWDNLDSLADLLEAKPVYSSFVTFTLEDDPTSYSVEQRDFLNQPRIEFLREYSPQDLFGHEETER